jgi:hypothetical protein|nr:MAG TPA: hypothetical protein [Caudoviricetes sp.]
MSVEARSGALRSTLKKPANRKLIYIWDENLAYFNSLPNKSAVINLLLKKARADG